MSHDDAALRVKVQDLIARWHVLSDPHTAKCAKDLEAVLASGVPQQDSAQMQTFEECLLMYRRTLRQALAHAGIASNPGVTDNWVLQQVTTLMATASGVPSPVCPHCELPAVLPAVCTPELHDIIERNIARDWTLLNTGYELASRETEPPA